jgi:MFS family permease
MYGGHPLFLFGLGWQTIWSLAGGFARNEISINICRAFQGFGPAAFLPASLVLISKTYRPGPRKNIVFSIYGACAPVGFFAGILVSGIAGQFLDWRWYFWLGSIISAIAVVAGWWAIPSDAGRRKNVVMDWWGAAAIVSGLVLVVAAITQSSRAPDGWATPYIIVVFILGVASLALAVWVEGWIATAPLLPFDMFLIPGMPAMVIALFLSYGVFGTWLLYTTF